MATYLPYGWIFQHNAAYLPNDSSLPITTEWHQCESGVLARLARLCFARLPLCRSVINYFLLLNCTLLSAPPLYRYSIIIILQPWRVLVDIWWYYLCIPGCLGVPCSRSARLTCYTKMANSAEAMLDTIVLEVQRHGNG